MRDPGSQEEVVSFSTVQQPPSDGRDMCPVHNRQIILLCILVMVPMLAFTISILWLVFGNQLRQACPNPELCPTPWSLNMTKTTTDYIVDFPTARLVFIASWSSTLSFSLIGPLMAIYSYVPARRWLLNLDTKRPSSSFPTPYQTGVLLRILNAEIITLPVILCAKFREIFWERKRVDERASPIPPILRSSVLVFSTSICLSLFIQATDTYLHIATEAIEWTGISSDTSGTHAYSYELSHSCLNRTTVGINNVNYWGCSMLLDKAAGREDEAGLSVATTNWAEVRKISLDRSSHARLLDYWDDSGDHMALLAPRVADPQIDWSASSFGVSTQCRGIQEQACELQKGFNISHGQLISVPFNCTADKAGVNVSGNLTQSTPQVSFLDFHRFIHEDNAFRFFDSPTTFTTTRAAHQAAELREDDAATVFANPWNWIAASPGTYTGDIEDFGIWSHPYLGLFFMFHCTTSVWDVDYTFVNGQVTNISHRLSNSTTAGIVSMAMAPLWNFANDWYAEVEQEIFALDGNINHLLKVFARGANRRFVYPFAGQTSTRSASSVQRRHTKLVSKVPKAALWALITANLLFVLYSSVLAAFALRATSADVHQVHTRMGILGLTAHIFEHQFSKRRVKGSDELFEERNGEGERIVKRVKIERTDEGGATYSLSEGWED